MHNSANDASAYPEAGQPKSLTVLVAEDDPMFRRLLERQLQGWGFQTVVVEDGSEAWKIIQQTNAPELLILDWMMPGIDGVELCRRVRKQQSARYPYVLLLTGKDAKQDVIDGLNSGADDYLTKPFDIGELHARLRSGKRILSLQRQLIQAQEALRFEATHDALTGLWSRGATLHLLGTEMQRSIRANTSTGILMIDLDHFKHVNDTYGHLAGDEVLKEAACRISQAVRSYDFVGRYGGEEFLAILTSCTLDDLRTIAERIRSTVADLPIATRMASVKATVSIGAVVTSTGAHELESLAAADSALYEAKRSGRNRVIIGSCEPARSLEQQFPNSGAIAHA
jgi:two-component system, cell cycle response regulator